MQAHSFFEAGMLVCFGASWPMALLKTIRTKNVQGLSIAFFWLIFIGYGCGLLFKVLGEFNWVFFFYLLNMGMVGAEIMLYYRYRTAHAGSGGQS